MATEIVKQVEVSSFNPSSACYMQWWEETNIRGFTHYRSARWATERKPKVKHFEEYGILGSALGNEAFDVLFEKDGCLVRIQFQTLAFGMFISSDSKEKAEAIEKWLREAYPKLTAQDDESIALRFWFHSPQGGGQSLQRLLSVPLWEEIRENYGEPVQEELDKLMDKDFRPSHGGQLILWQGPPGTGKTFAIRALVRQWAKWCDSAYVIDPEAFFGDANYMMQAMLHVERHYADYADDAPALTVGDEFDDVDDETVEQPELEEAWRLLIVEDAGELLAADAKIRTNQAFSRLLNIADGLIGQGLKVLILITTNEEVKDLHEAVQRPGRCASHIIFPDLTPNEANKWLESKKVEERVNEDTSLASLFGIVDGFRVEDKQKLKQKRSIGFGHG